VHVGGAGTAGDVRRHARVQRPEPRHARLPVLAGLPGDAVQVAGAVRERRVRGARAGHGPAVGVQDHVPCRARGQVPEDRREGVPCYGLLRVVRLVLAVVLCLGDPAGELLRRAQPGELRCGLTQLISDNSVSARSSSGNLSLRTDMASSLGPRTSPVKDTVTLVSSCDAPPIVRKTDR
jgi:hypothetical protein